MEKGYPKEKKIIVSLDAELISGGKSYDAVIGNLSEGGAYVRIASTKTAIDFTPGTTLELKFQLPSGEIFNLHCKVMWLYKTPLDDLTKSMGIDSPPEYTAMGMEIIDPPPKYKEFFKTL